MYNHPAKVRVYDTSREIGHSRLCACPPNHINCMTAAEWLKAQMGVWRFHYEGRVL